MALMNGELRRNDGGPTGPNQLTTVVLTTISGWFGYRPRARKPGHDVHHAPRPGVEWPATTATSTSAGGDACA